MVSGCMEILLSSFQSDRQPGPAVQEVPAHVPNLGPHAGLADRPPAATTLPSPEADPSPGPDGKSSRRVKFSQYSSALESGSSVAQTVSTKSMDSMRMRDEKGAPGLVAALLERADVPLEIDELLDKALALARQAKSQREKLTKAGELTPEQIEKRIGRKLRAAERALHFLCEQGGVHEAIASGNHAQVVAYAEWALSRPDLANELLPFLRPASSQAPAPCRALLEQMSNAAREVPSRQRGQMLALYGIYKAVAQSAAWESKGAAGADDDAPLDLTIAQLFDAATTGPLDSLRLITVALAALLDGAPESQRPMVELEIRRQLSNLRRDSSERATALLHCFMASDLHEEAIHYMERVWKHGRQQPLPFAKDLGALFDRMLAHQAHELLPRPREALVGMFSTLGSAAGKTRGAGPYAAAVSCYLDRLFAYAAGSQEQGLELVGWALDGLIAGAPDRHQAEALRADIDVRRKEPSAKRVVDDGDV
jgi:hypothetical protein